MSAELISIYVLGAIFVIATLRPINIGAMAFVAAFLVGPLAGGMALDDVLGGFPGDIFMVLVGVTFLFAIARDNGTVDWIVDSAVRLVGGRIILLPFVMMLLTGLLAGIGAAVPASVAIVAPIAMGLAFRHGINKLLLGVMLVHGSLLGGFSPISVFGVIVNGVVERGNLPGSPIALFLSSLVVNLVLASIAFVVLGGLKLPRAPVAPVAGGSVDVQAVPGATERPTMDVHIGLTLVGIVVMVACALIFDIDVGPVAITVGVALALLAPNKYEGSVAKVAWPVVLLVCGMLTYVGVLEEIGTIDYVSNAVAGIGAPLLGALLLCYIGAVVSAFASTTGLIGALIPLAVPFMAAGAVTPIGMVSALSISSSVVDISPFSTSGAIILANSEEKDREVFYRRLIMYGSVMVVAAPLVMWLILIVPAS